MFREPERAPEPGPEPTPEPETEAAPVILPASSIPWRFRWAMGAGAVVLAAFVGVAGLLAGLRYRPDPPPPSDIERFWAPVTSSVNPTTSCLGEPAKNIDVGSINSLDASPSPQKQEPLYFRLHYSGNLALADVITLTRTVAALASRHKAFRVVPAS